MTAPVHTQGPVDDGASFRAKAYAGASVLLALLGLGVAAFGLSKGIADGGTQIIQGILTLIGASAPAVASAKTRAQVANGTFDPAPPPSPAIVAVDGVKAMVDQVSNLSDAVAEGVQRIQDIAGVLPALGQLTALGPLAQEIVNQGRTP